MWGLKMGLEVNKIVYIWGKNEGHLIFKRKNHGKQLRDMAETFLTVIGGVKKLLIPPKGSKIFEPACLPAPIPLLMNAPLTGISSINECPRNRYIQY